MSHMTPKDAHEREKLPAEKKFDGWVYGGISYLAQAVAGSGLTYWMRHAGGRPIFDKIANFAGPNIITPITGKVGAAAVKLADSLVTVSTMVFVGSLFVIPVKWLEDVKAGIVEKWTKSDNTAREARGETISPEEMQQQAELLDQLKAAPKQNWWSLGIGRAVSLIPVYTAVPLIGSWNQPMEKAFQGVTKFVAKTAGLKKLANSEAFKNASGIAFYDGFYSIISAGGLYVYSHFIAPPQDIIPNAPAAPSPVATPEAVEPETASPEVKTNHQARVAKGVGSYVEHVSAPSPSLQAAI